MVRPSGGRLGREWIRLQGGTDLKRRMFWVSGMLLCVLHPVAPVLAQDKNWLLEVGRTRTSVSVITEVPVEVTGFPFVGFPSALATKFAGWDSGFRIAVARRVFNSFLIEAAYADLGTFPGTDSFVSCSSFNSCSVDRTTLSAEQWMLALRYEHVLFRSLNGSWKAGVARTEFSAATESSPLPPGSVGGLFPLQIDLGGEPEGDDAWFVAAGLDWRFSPSLGVGVTYHHHRLHVGDVDSIDLSLRVEF